MEFKKKAKLIYVDKNQNSICLRLELRLIGKEHKITFWVLEIFCFLI